MKKLAFVVLTILCTQSVAAEPIFCDPDVFRLYRDRSAERIGGYRDHYFNIGQTTIAGLAVGLSLADTLIDSAKEHQVDDSKNYCTWYFNNFNWQIDQRAREIFNWQYLKRMYEAPNMTKEMATKAKYEEIMGPWIDQKQNNFVGCLSEFNYLAIGCGGMEHRGPNIFAMLLGFAGCSPKNAAAIANEYWELNGVPASVREAVAEKGFELGQLRVQSREKLLEVLSGETPQAKIKACETLKNNDPRFIIPNEVCRSAKAPAESLLACGKIALSSTIFKFCADLAFDKKLHPKAILACRTQPTVGATRRIFDCLSGS